jgi:hypothetical protein
MRSRHRVPIEALAAIALALVLGCSDSVLAGQAIVYQCQRDGVRVFSDRPCGDDARPRRGTALSRRNAATDCHALQQQIDAIDTRMRLGYRGKEGEKLHARRRAASELYREQRCNTTARRARP